MTTAADQAFQDAFAAHQHGQLDVAAAGYEAVLKMAPEHGQALHMYGVLRMQTGDPASGARLIAQAVRYLPEDARAHSNLASALMGASRLDEAIEAARRASELDPQSADAWGNLGTALARRHRYPEAVPALQRATELRPDRPGLHSVLGTALGYMKEYEAALASHRRAIELAPDRPQYRSNMAVTMRLAGLTAEAEAVLRQIVEQGHTDPDYFVALASLLKKLGRMAEATGVLDRISAPEARAAVAPQLMFIRNYVDATTIEVQLQQAREAAEHLTDGIVRMRPALNDRDPERRLRIGLVSADLRQHAVALFLLGVVRAIDQSRYELFAYSGADTGDEVNLAFKAVIPNWRGTSSVTDAELAEIVRRDRIDILIDLSGPTTGGRLGVFARKPAPVSAIWLGYSGTSGHEAMDYIIGDATVLPEGVVQATETEWRLPDAYLCFQPTQEPPPVAPAPALRNGFVTFGSFNNLSKLSDATLHSWAAILSAMPQSRLMIKGHQGSSAASDTIVERLGRLGVAADRIGVLDWVSGWCEHLPLYEQIDIGLDPFPYNGTTTTCETLLMGVPVVSLRGDRFISRVGATLLHTVGLDDWVADSVEDYVALAVEKAGSIDQLADLRSGLRQQFLDSPLCDTQRFARNFESALRDMWKRYCDAPAA